MREILFKGKRKDSEEWVFGYLFDDGMIDSNRMFVGSLVIEDYKGNADDRYDITGIDFCEVIPETICQYTGLKDEKGEKIFENDILNVTYSDEQGECHHTENYVLKDMRNTSIIGWLDYANELEIVGNAFDNAELL